MRRVGLILFCCVCYLSAGNVPQPISGGEGTELSTLTLAGTPTLQIRVYGGTRTLLGDARACSLGVIYNNYLSVDTSWMVRDTFAISKVSGGIGIAFENSVQLPIHFSLAFDVQFGTFTTVGGSLGLGYNHCVAENTAWLQIKSDIILVGAYYGKRSFPGLNSLRVKKTNIYDMKLNIASTHLLLRPEINGYYRVLNPVLLMGGVGYQLPLLDSNVRFLFSGNDGSAEEESVSETLKATSSSMIFKLDGKRAQRLNAVTQGLMFNLALVFEI